MYVRIHIHIHTHIDGLQTISCMVLVGVCGTVVAFGCEEQQEIYT